VEAVRADHEVERLRRATGKRDRDAVALLVKTHDPFTEPVVRSVTRPFVEDAGENTAASASTRGSRA
jgi:hypothetical protein